MPRFRFLLPVQLSVALGLVVTAGSATAQNCDCSCEAFENLRSIMEDYRAQAESGERTMPPPEIQQMAACAGQCAMEWGRCTQTRASDASPAYGERSDPDPEPTPGRDEPSDPPADYALGEPRDDLDRFYGVYGSADEPGRDFFVAAASNPHGEGRRIPDGYLMIGAMWGDVAPWYMASTGELRFEQRWVNPAATPLEVAFEVDENGQATALRFLSGFAAERGRLEREGDLPEGW